MSTEELKEHMKYIQSDECRQRSIEALLNQSLSYLNNKYRDKGIIFSFKENINTIEIKGGTEQSKQIVLQDLNSLGFIAK